MKKLFTIVLISILAVGFTRAQTVVFSEDFSHGIPSGWGNSGISGGSNNPYAVFHGTTSGSHGAYGTPTDFINSPTKANGFVIFDSDSLDNGGVAGAFGLGPAPAPQTVDLTTTAINVAGFPYLRLQFYQYFRNFNSLTSFGVSTDSVNWVMDTINGSVATNANIPSNSRVSQDISSIVSGHSQIWLRFHMEADYYFWMIDDISIITLPSYDLAITSSQGVYGNTNFNLFYSSIPVSQADSFIALTRYKTIGIATETNCNATFTELKGGVLVTTKGSDTVPTLAYLRDTFTYNTFNFTGKGNYAVGISVSADSADFDPTNNTDTIKVAVSDSVYSINSSLQDIGGYYVARTLASTSFRWGTLFDVTNADTVTSITTAMDGGTTSTHAGAILNATIYQVVDSIINGAEILWYDPNNPIISTFPKTLAAGDLSPTRTGAVVPIVMPIDISTGQPGVSYPSILAPGLYWVAISGTPAPNDSMVVAAATPFANGGQAIVEQNNQLLFYNTTQAVYCNMNFGRSRHSLLTASFTYAPALPKRGQSTLFTATSNASSNATYRWTLTGLIYTSLSDTRYGQTMRDTFADADSILVCLTVRDGNDSVTVCQRMKVRDFGAGIDDVQAMSASLVPNPSTGMVTIHADDVNGKVAISITNVIGEEVKHITEQTTGSLHKSYNLSDLSDGVYIVKIQNGENSITRKLSISK